MTTFTYKEKTYSVVYIDPSASSSGSGSTYTSPLNDFPSTVSNDTCYLIRRTSSDFITHLPMGDHTSIQNIWLMGMPTKDDVLEWNLLDSEVKNSWGEDTAKYANISVQPTEYSYNENGHCFCTNNLVELNANRCYFFRDSNGPSSASYCNSMFRCTSSRPSYSFKHCKFGYWGNDVENDSYISDTEAIDYDSTTYPQYKWCNYLYVSSMNRLLLSDCVINYRQNNHTNDSNGSHPLGFHIEGHTYEAVIKDTIFNLMATSEGDREDISYRSCIYLNYMPDYLCSIENVKVNYIYNGTDWLLPSVMYNAGTNICQVLNVKNIDFNVKKLSSASPSPRSDRNMYSYDIGFRFYGAKNYNIDNFNVNFNEAGLGIPYCRILTCETFWRQSPGLMNKTVKNIQMTYCQNREDLICDSRLTEGSNKFAMYFGSDYGNTSNDAGEQTTDWRTAGSYDSPILSNININCPWGASLQLHHATLIDGNLAGRLQLDHGCGVELNSLYNNYGSTYGVYLQGLYNYLRIKNYTVNKSNALSKYTGNQWQISQRLNKDYMLMANNVYVDNSNAPMFDLSMATTRRDHYRNCAFVCPNMGASGQYYQRNQHCSVQSWNSKRENSSALASYKFVNNNTSFGQYDHTYDLVLGMEPYNGFHYIPTKTGKALLTFYIGVHDDTEAFIDNDLLHDRFYIDVNTPHVVKEENDNIIYNDVKTYSLDCGALLNDTSKWENDDTVVSKKIVMPIEIETIDKPINIRVHYGWYDLVGYCYLDPEFTVEYDN